MAGEHKLKPGSEPTLKLLELFRSASPRLKGLRRPVTEEVFTRLALIYPERLLVVNYGRRKPAAAFNPGALLSGDRLLVYPRLVFEYYWYVSSIGLFELELRTLQGLEEVGNIPVRIVLHPSGPEDLRGCEDPRVQDFGGRILLLYTSVSPGDKGVEARQSIAEVEGNSARKLGHVRLKHGDEYYSMFWKDSALVGESPGNTLILTRPSIPLGGDAFLEVGWSAPLDFRDLSVSTGSMTPLLVSEDFEIKVGWSTNALKISSNEYIVGWHGVGRDYIYRNGLALVDSEGNLLGISDYLLSPKPSIEEFYGDRPGVIFGCGLVKYQEYLLWVGGVSDYAIGIWRAELDEALEHLRYVRG